MGEIGRERHEYLYDMEYWEIMLILRGYRRRNVLHYQLQRLIAFYSAFCFAGNKNNVSLEEFCPMYFDEKDAEMSDEDIEAERARIAEENKRIEAEKQAIENERIAKGEA